METSTKVFLILQLASKGDLLEYINNRTMLSEDEVRMLFCQLAAAMAYCHKEQVVHRDLKCENILIGGDDKLKVTGNVPENFNCHSYKPRESNFSAKSTAREFLIFPFGASYLQCKADHRSVCIFLRHIMK